MDFYKEDVSEWENALYERNLIRVYGDKADRQCRKKSNLRYNGQYTRPTFWWVKECPKARKYHQKSFRVKMKRNLYNEVYYHVRARDYKTYGYLTW